MASADEESAWRPAYLQAMEVSDPEVPEAPLTEAGSPSFGGKVCRTALGLSSFLALNAAAQVAIAFAVLGSSDSLSQVQREAPAWLEQALAGHDWALSMLQSPALQVAVAAAPYAYILLLLVLAPAAMCGCAPRQLLHCSLFCLTLPAAAAALMVVGELDSAARQTQALAERCGPAACGRDDVDMEEQNMEWLDCMAVGQFGGDYKAVFPENRGKWRGCPGGLRLLSCQDAGDMGCRGGSLESWRGYRRGFRGAKGCPCGSAPILDEAECRRAFDLWQQRASERRGEEDSDDSGAYNARQRNLTWQARATWHGLSGCQMRGRGVMTFNANGCSSASSADSLVCVEADSFAAKVAVRRQQQACHSRSHSLEDFANCRRSGLGYALGWAARELKDQREALLAVQVVQGLIFLPLALGVGCLLWCGCRCPKQCREACSSCQAVMQLRPCMQLRAWCRMQAWLVEMHMQGRDVREVHLQDMQEPLAASGGQASGAATEESGAGALQ